ncbi:MAG: hypothetical protein NT007_01195 [Candidatus Kapabacteria bacterium]|nr:hypothetical protein [Candidatus Kapabacteria bacterium]
MFIRTQINTVRLELKGTSKRKSYSSVGQALAGGDYSLTLK